jgi:hypothetical protein
MQPLRASRISPRSRTVSAHACGVPNLSTYSVPDAFHLWPPQFVGIAREAFLARDAVCVRADRLTYSSGASRVQQLRGRVTLQAGAAPSAPSASSGSSRSAATDSGSGTTDTFVLSACGVFPSYALHAGRGASHARRWSSAARAGCCPRTLLVRPVGGVVHGACTAHCDCARCSRRVRIAVRPAAAARLGGVAHLGS